ncbi:MAG: transaldolase [candidate division WOR-3 bacterium]|uniref:Transaldolase n=1 Tax=candidate division WOR-3 bacterium TaxID=2052148 RepID=A0A7C1SJR5_UNCW3|nr:transaldolase [candidate division WOR-3 bacterium]
MIFIDSADINEVKQAVALGFVRGCTTNPALLAKVRQEPQSVIAEICRLVPGPVFYQLTGRTREEREQEAREFYQIAPDKIVLKVPMTTENMALVTELTPEIPCAATAVFSGYQTLLAIEAGCSYVIPYVNRATRLLGDGLKLVREMLEVVRASGRPVEIVAASIKTSDEAGAAYLAGAHHLTLPLAVIQAFGNHQLSEAAIAEFDRYRA